MTSTAHDQKAPAAGSASAPSLSRAAALWLPRGDAILAISVLSVVAVIVLAGAGSIWVAVDEQRRDEAAHQLATTRAVGELLAHSAEMLLAADDLTGLRRLVTDTASANHLQHCRILLAGGEVLADADPSAITAPRPPDQWSGEVPVGAADATGSALLSFPIRVPGRGVAALEVEGPPLPSRARALPLISAMSLIGAAALLAVLVVHRGMRSRLWIMAAIREALLSRMQGVPAGDAVLVHDGAGPEGQAWNELLREHEGLLQARLRWEAREAAGLSGAGAGHLEGACDALWHGLLLVGRDEKVCYANGAAAVQLRIRREDIAGRDIAELLSDPGAIELVRRSLDGRIRRRSTIEVRSGSDAGNSVLRVGVRTVQRGDVTVALLLIEDITQQRLAEEGRNAFVAQATHELRTPLTNIRLYAENALGETDPAVRAECLSVINQEARRLERIVGDMLSVAEIEAGTLKLRVGDVRLESLFEELRADYQAQADARGITLTFNLPPKLPVLVGDRDKIVLALQNLLGNALKYTPEGGSVTVTAEITNGQLTVDVSDTGMGIAPEEAELVFEKFYRSRDQRVGAITGTGLGLAVAREVIRLHHGDISVQSEIDKGSTFTLTVPSLAEAA